MWLCMGRVFCSSCHSVVALSESRRSILLCSRYLLGISTALVDDFAFALLSLGNCSSSPVMNNSITIISPCRSERYVTTFTSGFRSYNSTESIGIRRTWGSQFNNSEVYEEGLLSRFRHDLGLVLDSLPLRAS